MTASVPTRSIVALALCAAAAMALLALPGRSSAQVRNTPCASARTVDPRHAPHACVRSAHASKGRAHAQPTARGRHFRHSAAKHRAAKRRPAHGPAKKRARSSTPVSLIPAICEDGGRPVSTGGGRFSCDDESEPMCEDGSPPVPSQDGSRLECKVSAKAGASEASCEDGSAPVLAGEGQFSCDDESEPACEDGTAPTLSSGSSLVCDAGPPARSDGWAARTAQSPGGMRRRLASGS